MESIHLLTEVLYSETRGPPSAKKTVAGTIQFEAANGVTAAANGVTAATSKKCGFTGISDEATLLMKP